jgi:hypothetical protein
MTEIIVAEDYLRYLEKRFGPAVRYMGPWNSDGSFGYCSVGIAVIERALDSLCASGVDQCVRQLKEAPDPTGKFIELLQSYGTVLIERIVAAHQRKSQLRLVSRERSATNVA